MEKKIKLQEVHTSQYSDGEILLSGKAFSKNWYEEEITIVLDAHEVLEWIGALDIKKRQKHYINKIID